MTRTTALFGSALFLVLAPGTIAGLIPWLIVQWPAPVDARWAAIGLILLIPGAILLLDCFRRFAVQGLGTPAPVAPPERLIVSGAYRFVRNPMYVAVVSLILGQAALFASLPVLIYGLAVWAGFHAFVLGVRGADAAAAVSGRLHRILRCGSAVGAAFHTVGRDVAYALGAREPHRLRRG